MPTTTIQFVRDLWPLKVKMPRQKPSAPQRLDQEAQNAQNWNMGQDNDLSDQQEDNEPSLVVQEANEVIDLINDEPEQEIAVSVQPPPKKKAKKSQKSKKVETAFDNEDEKAMYTPAGLARIPLVLKPVYKEWSAAIFELVLLTKVKSVTITEDHKLTLVVTSQHSYIDVIDTSTNNGFIIPIISSSVEPWFFKAFGTFNSNKLTFARSLDIDSWDKTTGEMKVKVMVTETTLLTLGHPSDVHKVSSNVRRMLDHIFDFEYQETIEELEAMKHDIDQVYSVIKKHHEDHPKGQDIDPQHPSLLPLLRPYQKQAVRWMLSRERLGEESSSDDEIHSLYKEVKTLNGEIIYYNVYGGYLTKDKPLKVGKATGGILADEMGLGKTVEVLSLMLNNPRSEVALPEVLEPIYVEKKVANRRAGRRRRTPSPVVFEIKTDDQIEEEEKLAKIEKELIDADEVNEVEDIVDIADTSFEDESGIDFAEQRPNIEENGAEQFGNRKQFVQTLLQNAEQQVLIKEEVDLEPTAGPSEEVIMDDVPEVIDDDLEFKVEPVILQIDGEDDNSDVTDTSDEDFVPEKKSNRVAKAKKIKKSLKPHEESSSDQADSCEEDDSDFEPEYVPRPTARKVVKKEIKIEPNIVQKVVKKKQETKKAAKVIKTGPNPNISRFLGERKVTPKSPITDQILDAIIKLKATEGSSVVSIKTYIVKTFNKNMQRITKGHAFRNSMIKLVDNGFIVNTKHSKSILSGSFMLNPDYENFDSRSIASKNVQDSMDEAIEQVITDNVYDGVPFNDNIFKAKQNTYKKAPKKKTTYEKLKNIYDARLNEYSESLELTPEYRAARRKWNGTFFDTHIEQSENFECLCGTEAHVDYDALYRVQCTKCNLWQHAACVKYDVTDPLRGPYICPHCWAQEPPVESKATLIISPSSISYQWIEEIQKHIKNTKVRMLFYEGTKASGYIQPRDLANYDIVVTSYTILQSETNYVDLPHSNSSDGRRLRNAKRYMAIPAPLPCVQWWRICLDEAQMIECTTTKTAEMALRLSAVHRWCVTGNNLY